jgi:SAM-dependent methyltransferase
VSPKTSYELTRCPVCDESEHEEIAGQDDIKREIELLWSFHERRLEPGVPPERLTDRLAFAQRPPLRVARCARCRHLYRNPWERRSSLVTAYEDVAPSDELFRALFDTQRATFRAQARRLTRVAGRAGRGLEVGSYVGGFLAAARDRRWVFEGLDVNERAATFAGANGFKVTHGEIEAMSGSEVFDAVAIWNTFEQLYDARAAIAAARRLLVPQGILVIRVPNGEFYARWRARLDHRGHGLAVALLAHNNLLTFPYRQGFGRQSIGAMLEKSGFAPIQVHGDTLVPIADRWTTRYGRIEERAIKTLQRVVHRAWAAPWVEVYARREASELQGRAHASR